MQTARVTSRDERAKELAELARKREEYWDRRWEAGRHRRAIGVTVLLVGWVSFLVAYWFMLDDPDRRWNVVLIAFATTLSTGGSVWWRRRRDRSAARDRSP
jgi:hypothetical protein